MIALITRRFEHRVKAIVLARHCKHLNHCKRYDPKTKPDFSCKYCGYMHQKRSQVLGSHDKHSPTCPRYVPPGDAALELDGLPGTRERSVSKADAGAERFLAVVEEGEYALVELQTKSIDTPNTDNTGSNEDAASADKDNNTDIATDAIAGSDTTTDVVAESNTSIDATAEKDTAGTNTEATDTIMNIDTGAASERADDADIDDADAPVNEPAEEDTGGADMTTAAALWLRSCAWLSRLLRAVLVRVCRDAKNFEGAVALNISAIVRFADHLLFTSAHFANAR